MAHMPQPVDNDCKENPVYGDTGPYGWCTLSSLAGPASNEERL